MEICLNISKEMDCTKIMLMNNFRIRKWDPKTDLEYFIQQEFIAIQEMGFLRITSSEDDAFQKHKADIQSLLKQKEKFFVFFIETSDDNRCGYIWLADRGGGEPWDFDTNTCWIYDIRVKPEYQRKGLGKMLLEKAIQWARAEGFSKIGLHVFSSNSKAYNLYCKVGFNVSHCYHQKFIQTEKFSNNEQEGDFSPFTIRSATFPKDKEVVRELIKDNFTKIVLERNNNIAIKNINERYNCYMDKIDLSKEKHQIFIVENQEEEIKGYVWGYRSKGDIGEKEYLWLQDIAVENESLETLLIQKIENWAIKQNLDTIRTGVRTSKQKFWFKLSSLGFHVSNYFMEINL
ncbi:MAG: GNAT family N-acetyltransferase [Candidatus Heimdallarchaeota archaeon]|nr:GNAT family N-acetyltransferase [Candidatus Heimdallarchaeota archaeon]